MHKSGLTIASEMTKVFDFRVESEGISSLNSEILRHFNLAWSSVESISPQNLLTMPESFAEAGLGLISALLSTAPRLAFKDAQFCRLMPFWQNVLAPFNIPVYCLIINRHPLAIAHSLHSSDNFPSEHTFDLWRAHMLEASSFMHPGWKRLVVDYDILLDDPLTQLTRLGDLLSLGTTFGNIAVFRNAVRKEIQHAFVNSNVRLSHYPNHQVLWENLHRLSKGETIPNPA